MSTFGKSRSGLPCFYLIIFFLTALSPVISQEQQVEFAPQLEVIDRELADEISVFQEYEDFKEARLFLQRDSSWVLEIYTLNDGQTIKNRESISEEELSDLKRQIRSKITENPSLVSLNQRGRSHLIVGSIPLGLYYGTSLGVAVSDNGGRAAAALPLLIGGGLTVTTILATKDKEVTHAMGSMGLNGGLMGIAHGGMFLGAVEEDGWDGETFLGVSSLFSIGEGLAFYAVAKKNNFSPGRGAMWNFGNFWGAGYGMGLTALLSDFDKNHQYTLAGGLVGSGLGIWASQALYQNHPHTPGNVSGVSNLTINGAFLGLSLIDFADFEGASLVAASLVGCSALGAFTGFAMMKNHRFNSTEGLYLILGNLGGGLVGSGIGVLTGVESSGATSLLGVAGGMAGLSQIMH